MSPSVLLLALQVAATPASGLSPAEQHYVDARAAANERFGKGAGPEDAERRAMADLEAQLRAIVGPVRLPGLSGVGKLAYDGFWGVGSQKTADGLFFQWREDRLFVTTRSLYERAVDWARAQMRRSTTGRSAEDNRAVDQELASVTVSCDAAYLAFADVPAGFGHREHRDRRIVIAEIAHRDRSEATLAGSLVGVGALLPSRGAL